MKFVVCMDKCYFESYVYGKLLEKRRGSILDVVRLALKDENYLSKDPSDSVSSSIILDYFRHIQEIGLAEIEW